MKILFQPFFSIAAAGLICVPNGQGQYSSLDLSFDPGARPPGMARPVAVQPDQKRGLGGGLSDAGSRAWLAALAEEESSTPGTICRQMPDSEEAIVADDGGDGNDDGLIEEKSFPAADGSQ